MFRSIRSLTTNKVFFSKNRMLTTARKNIFPSLTISNNNIFANGQFAELQAIYLNPDQHKITKFKKLMKDNKIGIVAHFYMDAELQGVINKCDDQEYGSYVTIADSLAMGQKAIEQAKKGIKNIIVLGVDFMTENIKMMLSNEYPDVNVYKVSENKIGCSLAESAEKLNYCAYLHKSASCQTNCAHVIYINTSLKTKAMAQNIIPTITCTSSNVLKTILQLDVQVPNIKIFYGPDTYMGQNIVSLLKNISKLNDGEIKKVHPDHDKKSIDRVISNFDFYKQGTCIVHHMFGDNVVKSIRESYNDCYITAHLEVPGEMFELAMEKKKIGMGTVGSTSDIINFILNTVRSHDKNLKFVLGTESGMVTKIVDEIKKVICNSNKQVEIIFPISSESFVRTNSLDNEIVPGVPSGEGCSATGGCATCQFMKMNSLDSLEKVMLSIENDDKNLSKYLCTTQMKDHVLRMSMTTINNMRSFQETGIIPINMTNDINGLFNL